MKKAAILLCVVITTHLCFSQQTQKVRKVVQVMPQQSFFLNGGMRATFGGKSRTYYQIDLPKNTVEWYYNFSTSVDETTNTQSLNLVPQLTRLFDPSGATSILTSAIMTPTGSNACDIFLMNRPNADAFLNKIDNSGGKFYYTISGSRENYRNGTIQVKDINSGTYFLGFRNPSASTGIAISFEVAAIVEEWVFVYDEKPKEIKEQKTPDQEKAANYGNLGWRSYENGNVDKCIEYSQKAIALDNSLGWVKSNLGLCYLIKGADSTAIDYYLEALSDIKSMKEKSQVKHFLQATIEDIDNAVVKYPALKGSDDIKYLFEGELKNYE